jgi:hypothetical protein
MGWINVPPTAIVKGLLSRGVIVKWCNLGELVASGRYLGIGGVSEGNP